MTNRSSVSWSALVASEPLAWPAYPGVLATLLAAISATTLFTGLGTVTDTAWLTWIGLWVTVALVALHLWRYWQAGRKRLQVREQLNATLVTPCHSLESSTLLKRHHLGGEPVLLVLTDDTLHVGRRDPLSILATVPLYNVESISIAGRAAGAVLTVTVRTSGDRVHTLELASFEPPGAVRDWAIALRSKS